ncbi:SusC/RagA family TonB-linked outer membrane protein [Arachidicoccus soli]|uniref:SusC/RagA family TonB-linked outer membrane protein n=1 Tax=Arachidicoccus soli TaxID=2341117 RepID=A0A386HQZ8_9BACT|nr:SusC/RagA family TonB-linked outer membrane protein [Arachidicoccus soli]AYD48378.1 SusC/RagA family TonB-linked outer membrane protein [Arachidicoccus soli]
MKRKTIALRWAFALCFFFCTSVLLAQTSLIEGRIFSEKDRTPLGGASISVVSTHKGTFARPDGTFSVEAKIGDKLNISYTGYVAQTITINGHDSLLISLKEVQSNLDEVVVVGYGTQSRHDLSGAVATVNPRAFKSSPTSNIGTVLQGTVPGLSVSQSTGQPGSTPNIVFRGGNDWGGSGGPLVVLDGIVVPSVYGIDMDDVQSIDLLKDAASTAIYGARASNGVLLITTKKGKNGHSQITYTVRQTTNFTRKNPSDYLTAAQYISLNREGIGARYAADLADGNTNAANTDKGQLQGSWGWALNNGFKSPVGLYTTQLLGNDNRQLLNTPGWKLLVDPNPFVAGQMDSILYREQTVADRENMIFQQTNTTEHHLDFSGANEQGNFALGLGLVKDNGIIIGSGLKRLNMNFNGGLNIGKNLKVSMNTSAYTVNTSVPYNDPSGGGGTGGLLQRFIGVAPTVRYSNDTSGVALPGPNDPTLGNPAYWSTIYNNSSTEQRFMGGVNLDWTILPYLHFKASGSGYMRYDYNNYFTKSYQMGSGGAYNNNRKASFSNSHDQQYTYNAFFEYNKTLNGVHHLSAMAGAEFYDYKYYYNTGYAQGAPTDLIPWLTASTVPSVVNGGIQNPAGASSDFSAWERLSSAIGRINYSYKDLYFLTANFRYDGSSRLSSQNHYGFFPGVSLGWNMQKEDFFKNSNISKIVSTFRPRVSWGENGSIQSFKDAKGNQIYFPTAQVYNNAGIYNGNGGTYVGSYINTDLKWEKSASTNFGADIGLWNDRITLIGDYFIRNVYDKIASLGIDPTSGFSSYTTNLGELQNRGLELSLNARIIQPIQPDGLGIDFNANFYTVKNYAIKLPFNGLPGNRQSTMQVWDPNHPGQLMQVGGLIEGQRVGLDEVWAPKWDGIYTSQDMINADANVYNAFLPYKNKTLKQLGDAKWHQVYKNDTIDSRQFVYVGRTTPTVSGSFSTNISYKGFSLYAAFDYALGFVILNNEKLRGLSQVQGSQNSTVDALNTWSPTNPNGTLPRFYWANQGRNFATDASGNNPPANMWEKGDYVALRELTLSYDMTQNLLKRVFVNKVKALRVYVSGGNLAYFTPYSGNFPETGGIDNGKYPLPRRLTFGATVSL